MRWWDGHGDGEPGGITGKCPYPQKGLWDVEQQGRVIRLCYHRNCGTRERIVRICQERCRVKSHALGRS